MTEKTIGFRNEKGEVVDPPRISMNRDAWLQETVALLTETCNEMVAVMASNPKEVGPFLRVFSLVTHLAADTKKLLAQQGQPPSKPPVAGKSAGADNGDVEPRIKALEDFAAQARDRLVRIETRLDSMATKEDLHKELHGMTWKLIGVATALVAVVFFIARNVTP